MEELIENKAEITVKLNLDTSEAQEKITRLNEDISKAQENLKKVEKFMQALLDLSNKL